MITVRTKCGKGTIISEIRSCELNADMQLLLKHLS